MDSRDIKHFKVDTLPEIVAKAKIAFHHISH